jgi:hypothetical protein
MLYCSEEGLPPLSTASEAGRRGPPAHSTSGRSPWQRGSLTFVDLLRPGKATNVRQLWRKPPCTNPGPAFDNPYYRGFNCADFQPRDDGQLALVTLLAVFVIDAPIAPTQVTCRFCDPSRPVERTESLPPHAKDFGAAIVSAKAWLYIDSVQILIGGWHRRDV